MELCNEVVTFLDGLIIVLCLQEALEISLDDDPQTGPHFGNQFTQLNDFAYGFGGMYWSHGGTMWKVTAPGSFLCFVIFFMGFLIRFFIEEGWKKSHKC